MAGKNIHSLIKKTAMNKYKYIVDLGLENCSPINNMKRHFVEISLNKHKTLIHHKN
jgi:hypothetical protein